MNTYELIRSRRKTLALELTREGRLIVRAPLRISRREIDAFVEKHKDWIARHLAKQAARPTLPPPDAPETQALKTQAQAILPEKVAHWSSIMEVHPPVFGSPRPENATGAAPARAVCAFPAT